MIPMVPGLFLVFTPFKTTTAAMAVPVFAQNLIMNQVLSAQPIRALDYLLAAATATLLGGALAAIAVARCAHSRMLAGR
jgi:hypothetical protein